MKPMRIRPTLALFALVASTFLPQAGSAQDTGTSIADYGIKDEDFPIRYGIVPFLAGDAGYMSRNIIVPTEGVPTSLKLLGSAYFADGRGVFDLGIGRANQKFSQSLLENETLVTDVMEIGLRYQTANRWQFGLVGNTMFSQGERFAANQEDVQFAGLAAHKEFNLAPNWVARAGVKVMNDLNIPDADVQVATIDLQIGWNFSSSNQGQDIGSTATTTDEVTVLDLDTDDVPTEGAFDFDFEQTAATPLEGPDSATLAGVNSSTLDKSSVLNFSSGSRQVTEENRQKLAKLATALEENKDLFERVELIGHADKTGSVEANELISIERAQSVREAMVSGGLPLEKMSVIGKSNLEPLIDSVLPQGLRANRRVELRFHGVKDVARLEEVISSAQ